MKTRPSSTALSFAAFGAVVLSTAPGAFANADAAPPVIEVPRVEKPVTIDAELLGKKVWEADTGNTRNFTDAAGHGMVPYTEAKFRWGSDRLYLMLYAGDLDLEGTVKKADGPIDKDDSFRIEFGDGRDVRAISVSVLGTVADARCTVDGDRRRCDARWNSRAKVAVDRDGTLNKIGDNDEEWVVEMAVPFASLGISRPAPGTRIPIFVQRCEIGHDGPHACGAWGRAPHGVLVLER